MEFHGSLGGSKSKSKSKSKKLSWPQYCLNFHQLGWVDSVPEPEPSKGSNDDIPALLSSLLLDTYDLILRRSSGSASVDS